MSEALRRDLLAGGGAGLIGGLVYWLALLGQGSAAVMPGLIGFDLIGPWLALHLIASILAGAAFGGVLHHEPSGYAATISIGLLYGLLLWIIGPVTVRAVLEGQGPTWSLATAAVAFPTLIGHLFYGGITGLSFYLLSALYLHWRPPAAGFAEPGLRDARARRDR
ncbi:MAG: hypothetical protein ACE5Q6_08880, partial [Dehalococcoidia bacterium]